MGRGRAAADNQAPLITGVLRLGLNANAITNDGDTALHVAAKQGHLQASGGLAGHAFMPPARGD